MKKILFIASILLLSASCHNQVAVSPAPVPAPAPSPQPASSTSLDLPVKYDNTQYGFTFSLPQDWDGYTTYTKQWQGNYLPDNTKKTSGPIIYIRNPKWTAANPYEDIPVMVFTPDEWNDIQKENLSVSAAPIPPSELGQNTKYVFALPARYDYDFSTGYQEVEQIMQNSPLKAY